MYEHRTQPLLSTPKFLKRVARHWVAGFGVLGLGLGGGILGYHYIVGCNWIDSLLNASMILGGMGPVGEPLKTSAGAKIFASFYALFSGLALSASYQCCLHRLFIGCCIGFTLRSANSDFVTHFEEPFSTFYCEKAFISMVDCRRRFGRSGWLRADKEAAGAGEGSADRFAVRSNRLGHHVSR